MDIDDILREFDVNSTADASQDVKDLTRSWIAERAAPEILPYQSALLERLMERIRHQIEFVENETGNLDPTTNFRLILIQTELERVKYLVRSYLRARIHKIDKHTFYILSTPSVRERLSPSEQSYLKSHLSILNSHFQSSFLRNFPEKLRRLDDKAGGITMIDEPDLDSAVFCRVLKNVEEIISISGTGDDFRLNEDDMLVVRYSAIRKYVMSGDIELI